MSRRTRLQVLLLAFAASVVVACFTTFVAFAARTGSAAEFPGVVDINTNLRYQNAAAAGTGIVLSSSGIVLTNNHVIRGATTIRVTVPATGRTYAATVLGYSHTADVALLKLTSAPHLTTVALGHSAGVKVGQRVTAVGNAQGAGGDPAVTTGSITGLGRSITAGEGDGTSERLTGLIQINAGLEPGDSGGPLLDGAGHVIGIDTAASAGFSFQDSSAGFAIPIDRALALVKQIEAGKRSATVHIGPTAFLGISVDSVASQNVTGAAVAGVLSGSPAARVGVTAGAVVTSVDGTKVASPTALVDLLLRRSPGASIKLGWVDQIGVARSATLKLAAGPPQ